MEVIQKKKNRKPLYMVLILLSGFSLFVYGITRPSAESLAISELKSCYTIDHVKLCWEKYRVELYSSPDFVNEVRQRLTSFNLTEQEIESCKKWLPAPPQYLNLIIVPDLSKRIADNINNPGQISNDTIILKAIWEEFRLQTRAKTNTKDRLLIDVTDEGQAGGNFRTLADSLIYDLSKHNQDQSNILYFKKVGMRFNANIRNLYLQAEQHPIGADYWYYLNRNLPKRIRNATLFEEYRNVLILLTDGYLEAQDNQRTGVSLYTGSHQLRAATCNKIMNGKPINTAVKEVIGEIRDCAQHFPELEVLIVEVNERKRKSSQEPVDSGTPCDFDILETLWKNWFTTLEIRNAGDNFFVQRNDASQLTVDEVRKFLRKSSTPTR